MPGQYRLTVAAVVERAGEFLLVEEDIGGRLVLNQPAGHVEPGEDPIAAVIREVAEETARPFVPDAVLGIYLWQPPGTGRPYLRVAIAGSCGEPVAGQALDQGIVRSLWRSRAGLLAEADRLRSPMVLRAIDDYLAGARASLATVAGRAGDHLREHATRL